MTLRQAQKIVKKWQEIFRLHHWLIEIEFHKVYEDDELDGVDGYVRISAPDLLAHIIINEDSTESFERIILHECIHILVRNATIPLPVLLKTEDAEAVWDCLNELLVRRLEDAFMAVDETLKEV